VAALRRFPFQPGRVVALVLASVAWATVSAQTPDPVAAGPTPRAERRTLAEADTTGAARAPNGSGGVNDPAHREKASLVLISLDGFRADYLDRSDLPNVRRVLRRGARARAMVPVFPSLTFPNHYSLVTGLRPDRHGLVGNTFFDPVRQQTYSLRDPQTVGDGTWYRGEPIWVTAERQGMVAACYFWPGSEAAIAGIRPTLWMKYDGTVPNAARVDTVLDWLRMPEERRPHLLTLYMSDIDSASHQNELGTGHIDGALRAVDAALGRLLDGIDALPIRERVLVVLTSDHGMANTSAAQSIGIDSLIDMTGLLLAEGGPVGNLHVPGGASRAREVRDAINRRLRHGRAYLRKDVPERLRYRADPRIGDIVIIMNEGYIVETPERQARRTRKEPFGMHGWDPSLPSMHAIFAVAGPGVRSGVTVPPVENVDVYPFLTEVLDLTPARPLDGRPGRISGLVMARSSAAREIAAPGRRPAYFPAAWTSGSRLSR
jgi:predicted AlkP superfamily pyrophosphatase or phosphodiesterase